MAQCYISVRDVKPFRIPDGVKLVVTTDIACHLYMRWSHNPPRSHSIPALRRGLLMHTDLYFCFTAYHDNEQEEDGDTLTHTFLKTPWAVCECRYFYFWGKVGDTMCESDTPCFQLHLPAPDVPVEPATQSDDCQLLHDSDNGPCQFWNAFSQTFTPDHTYYATGLSLLLTQYDLTKKGPLVIKLELNEPPYWDAPLLWSRALNSIDLPLYGDYRYTSYVLPNILILLGTTYRITVHTTWGWKNWVNGVWVEGEPQAGIRWRAKTITNPYPRGSSWYGVNYRDKSGIWLPLANEDQAFCLSILEAETYLSLDRACPTGTDDCYTYDATIRLDYDYLYLDYATLDMHMYARFTNIDIPPGATIVKAYIDLQGYNSDVGDSRLRILGIKELNTATFSTQADADGRPVTTAFVNWPADSWFINQWYGGSYDKQDITAIIQEIIDQPGWASGNALAIKIINTLQGITRIARSHEGGNSPHLHIEYQE